MGEKVKENNEAISLQSQDGLGFANSSLAQNSIAPTGLDSAKKNLNIILIEDSEDEAMLLVNELKEAGFTLNFERTNSISGFEKLLDSSKWDCVIADHSMPSGRALSALKIFRKRDADIPFIILVGTVIDEDAVNAIKNGANDYILKDRRQRLIPAIERELREAEIRRKQRADDRMLRELNVAVEQTADGIVISNLDGVIRFANRACAEMHGLPIDEIIGRNISIFHTKEQFETGVAPLKDHVLQSASRTAKIGHVRKDGTIFFSWMSCTFLTDKNKTPNGFIFIARNLSEHKLEQEIVRLNETLEMEIEERVTELSLANAKIENLLTAASEVSIIATNNEGLITVFNPGSEKMLGYSASEVVGKQTPESFHLRTELEQRSAELSRLVGKTIKGFDVFAAIPRREGSELREWTYVRKDGTHFAVQLAITPMRSVDGEITGYLGIGTDLTRLKKAQEEIGELSRKNEMLLNAAGAGTA